MSPRHGAPGRLAALLALPLAVACATPIGVHRLDEREVHEELTRSALSKGLPSRETQIVVYRLGLAPLWASEPESALAQLREGLGSEGGQDRIFALAELAFLHAERRGGRPWYLAAAVYAYAFLFPGAAAPPPRPLDPRLRLAADLYNRALTLGLLGADGRYVEIRAGAYALPFGVLEIAFEDGSDVWAGHPLKEMVPAAELGVRGLRNRYRRSGLGAPLAASMSRPLEESAELADVRRIPAGLKVPVTAFLRLEEPRAAILGDRVRGRLELYSIDDRDSVEVADRTVPLESEPTAALAASLEGAPIWDMELDAFFSGAPDIFKRLRFAAEGLMMLHPYRPGRVPIVLVHGTASSPARWTELINELENDPTLGDRIQIWLFLYATGNPVAYSAGLLRAALEQARADLDPGGRDAALDRMVVIGHSQGGLLTKLMAVESGDAFWTRVSDEPLESLDLEPKTRKLLVRSLFFEPLPFVERVVFVATPHRGSYLTSIRWLGMQPVRLITGMIALPFDLAQLGFDAVKRDDDAALTHRLQRQLPTSVENMTPGNPFLETLAGLPISPRITAHSIIAVRGDGPPEEGNDGVVAYESAHIEGVASETIVRSGHSTQAEPATIEEIRRIVLVHLDGAPTSPPAVATNPP